jgi:hypothetical protein
MYRVRGFLSVITSIEHLAARVCGVVSLSVKDVITSKDKTPFTDFIKSVKSAGMIPGIILVLSCDTKVISP